MHTPLISIIIPTYNRAHLISETLDSVLAQTYTNWECIVVDDGSNDGTAELLETYCKKDTRFQYHHRPANRPKGANACRNYGFEMSKGEYINWFDSDDVMNKELIATKIEAIIYNLNSRIVVCGFSCYSQGNFISEYLPIKTTNYLESYLNNELTLNTFNILWHRDIVIPFKWDETLYKYQDLDFIFRVLINQKIKGISINKSLINVKQHKNNISNNNNKQFGASVLEVRKNIYRVSIEKLGFEMSKQMYHLYLFAIRENLSAGNYTNCYKELLGNIIKNRILKFKLFSIFTIHLISGRGLVLLTSLLIKHTK